MALKTTGEIIYNVPRYTFLQRLNGWKMERRQRINGRFDLVCLTLTHVCQPYYKQKKNNVNI